MKLSPQTIHRFRETVFRYYRKHGRDFPWRPPSLKLRKDGSADPYAILVSEIMLQQTQAERVVPKYLEWMKAFPTAEALAKAGVGDVLKKWQGLGYNRRALNLKRSAEMIVKEYEGVFPKTISEIDALPGVGPYTAGAIGAFAFGIPSAFIETNIRTVYLHFFFKGKRNVRDEEILRMIERTLPKTTPTRRRVAPPLLRGIRDWYNALMDYGAMLKRTEGNLNMRSAQYAKQSRFKGSKRELRGAILRLASENKKVTEGNFREYASAHPVKDIISELAKEGFLKKEGKAYKLQ